MTVVNICRFPEAALFHKLPDEVQKKSVKLITYMFLAAQITIAKHWQWLVVPFDYVKHKLHWIMVNDKLTCTLHNNIKKSEKFDRTWDPCQSLNLFLWSFSLFIILTKATGPLFFGGTC